MSMTLRKPAPRGTGQPVLIAGGAGFIGTNVAHRYLSAGVPVRIFDNLSRAGVEKNLAWLVERHGTKARVQVGDLRDASAVRAAARGVSHVLHLGAQVAVTTSLENPREDFDINVRGTIHLLEALREFDEPPSVIFTSTNKVYGHLGDVPLRCGRRRYTPLRPVDRDYGFGEDRGLEFASPYGCSKGAADQYVLDYGRSFGLRTVVFRMSCIYGPHQFGTEDQGWVAHFLIRALEQEPITLYGDGKQVRDILFVEDLVDAFVEAHLAIDHLAGEAFNIGGGPANTVSLQELTDLIGSIHGRKPAIRYAPWRRADQPYYVSDFRKFAAATGWRPQVGVREGVQRLYDWLVESRAERSRADSRRALRREASLSKSAA